MRRLRAARGATATDALHLLTGAYAVDALDPAERAAFRRHLGGCPDCTAEVRGLRAAATRLTSADVVEPPPRLRAAVLAQIAETRQQHPLAQARRPGGNRSVTRLRTRLAGKVVTAAAAALALLAVGLAGILAQTRSERSELAARAGAVSQVLMAGDARTITGDIAGGGRGAVVVSKRQGTAVFVASGLPEPGHGRVYQLWFMHSDGRADSAGTFHPDRDGQAARVLAGNPRGAAKVGLTVETNNGSRTPTTSPLLAIPLD
jgi:anti-sigma-K factor RskA